MGRLSAACSLILKYVERRDMWRRFPAACSFDKHKVKMYIMRDCSLALHLFIFQTNQGLENIHGFDKVPRADS